MDVAGDGGLVRLEMYRINRRLLGVATRQVQKNGLGLNSACGHLLTKVIRSGVERMRIANVLEREDQLLLAESSARRLMTDVCKRAMTARTFPIVEPPSLEASLKALCPVWPYC